MTWKGTLAVILFLLLLTAAWLVAGQRSLDPVFRDLIKAHSGITQGGLVASLSGDDPRLSEEIRERRFEQIGMTSFWISAGKTYRLPMFKYHLSIELTRDPRFPDAWTASRGLAVGSHVFKWGRKAVDASQL